jgi:hypothetical protein
MALLGWAGAYIVFTLLALVLVGGAIMSAILPIIQSPGTPPSPAAVMAMLPGLLGAFALLLPLALIFQSVLVGAVFRAVLEPENSAFAYLRLGGQELWLALVYFVQMLLFIVFYFAAAIVVGVVAAVGGRSGFGGLLIFLAVLASLAALIYLLVRFSLAGPASFEERRFALFDSWSLTRGSAGPLFLVALVIVLMCIGIYIVQFILNLVANLATMGFASAGLSGSDPAAIKQMFSNPITLFSRLGPIIIVQLILSSVFSAIYAAVTNAPWANAYRQVKGSPDTAATFS